MVKNRIKTFVIISLMCINILYAGNVTEKSGTTAFAFLKISQGARAAAMADCYTGLSDDVNAIYWNPAGISQLNSGEFTVSHIIWFESISRYYLGYVHPKFSFGTLGCSINYVSVGGIEKRITETDDTYESISVGNIALSFVFSRRFSNKIALGTGLKIIYENLDVYDVGGFAIDLGGLYKFDDSLSAGISIQNIGSQIGKKVIDPLPILLRSGVTKKLLQDKLIVLSELYLGLIDMTASLSAGSEYQLSKVFYPRIGYKYKITNNNLDFLAGLSMGFGLKYKIYQFDYAFVPYGDLGFTHRLDLLIKF